MYKVIEYFTDLQDGNHPYSVGDDFPRPGVKVSANRIAELASANNKRRKPLIAASAPKEEPEETKKGNADGRSSVAGNAKGKPGKKK